MSDTSALETSVRVDAGDGVPPAWETRLAATMFSLSVLFLLVVAVLIHRHRDSDWASNLELQVLTTALAVLWPIFVIEAGWRLLRRGPRFGWGREIGFFLLVSLLPATRMCQRDVDTNQWLWLPILGWRQVNRALLPVLEHRTSLLMILVALAVLPLLAIDLMWSKTVDESEGLRLFLEVSNGVIWLAFTMEFMIHFSIAEKRLIYIKDHWLDLAIIALPVLDFMPLLHTVRILRLQQLGRAYRLRGMAMRAWRALLILRVVQWILRQPLEKQLEKLETQLTAKEREIEDLKLEIQTLRARMEQQAAEAPPPREPAAVLPSQDIDTIP